MRQRLKTTTVLVTHDQLEAITLADRIVVMHDGIVEQIGTPLTLFDRPGNPIAAQSMGSPSMNVLKVLLRKSVGRVWVESQAQPWSAGTTLQARDGQAVHYGVRPGDITENAPGMGAPAKVIVVGPVGAETKLKLQVGEENIIVVMHGRTKALPDGTEVSGFVNGHIRQFMKVGLTVDSVLA